MQTNKEKRIINLAEIQGLKYVVEARSLSQESVEISNLNLNKVRIFNSLNQTRQESSTIDDLGHHVWVNFNDHAWVKINSRGNYFVRIGTEVLKNAEGFPTCKRFKATLVKYEARKNCTMVDCKNMTDGYWYTPEHEVPKYVREFLNSARCAQIMSFIYGFNSRKIV